MGWLCLSAAVQAAVPAEHARNMAASRELFASKVGPWLAANCLECHGRGNLKSGFSLATREQLLVGGDGGAVVLAGQSAQSPLVGYIAHEEEPHMPPMKPGALPEMVAMVRRWIDLGAAYDKPLLDAASVPRKPALEVTERDKEYWAYRPLSAVPVPEVRDRAWPRTRIDEFLLAKMEEQGITPVEEADRPVLVRRLYFDLAGLPPEPSEVEAVLAAPDFESAWESLVDRLLASPHFGERWARHWLDPARFAESHGFEHDYDRPFAFHYRDFVIRAFNEDMPYDQFVQWQLAGDELDPEDPWALAATGFLGAGVYPTQITTREAERVRYDAMDDMLATVGHAMLALTVGCARCHDHKYDPIPTRDYYHMLSAFTTTVRSEVDWDSLEPQRPPSTRTKIQVCTEGLKPMRHHVADASIPDFYSQTHFLNRGDVAQKDGVAEPSFLAVLMRHSKGSAHWQVPKPPEARTAHRRANLARWLTDVEHGAGNLAARAIVNRLWHHHMGRGIVATVNDFGLQAAPPTHPELLDWMAADLVNHGWRLKRLHKMIVMSRAYRLSCAGHSPEQKEIDPENRWWWHRPRRRLEAESIRDNLLAVGGMLDRTMYGPGTLDEGMTRRSIYFQVKRSRLVPMLQVFDWPDTLTSAGARPATVIAPQALLLLNSPLVRTCASGLAHRVQGAAAQSLEQAVDLAYRIALARPASSAERSLGVRFLESQRSARGSDLELALADFCQTLMSCNEFIYVD